MAISMGGGGGEPAPLSEINTTPLVDVMLVLLIIFLITIPVVIQTVKLELPVVAFEPTQTKAENVLLAITATDSAGRDPGSPNYTGAYSGGNCRVYWNTTPINSTELLERGAKKLKAEVDALGGPEAIARGEIEADQMPEVHIRGDINTPYKCIGGAIYQMQRVGFAKVGFISSPFVLDTPGAL